ncbi:MAG TPA: flagellar filament capping protein FliD [Marinospirillum sp.]|uniref:flagellar filament capping protein FliD n=1 Tax=Marinospirillum sp. TaxID=2183934 RepID=UPI002B48C57D|nr:flagellar filament capping protein FliD [Marinospirillum sp.]HKM16047.1 flagellar filament capping protein FliD [Marinospirillum sp.]
MSSISFNGLGSGLPIKEIIEATMKAESVPLKRMEAEKTTAKEQISAYGSLTSRLDALASAMKDLKGEEKFETVASKSSNESAFTATADHRLGAVAGNYSIEVLNKAESYRWVSESLDDKQAFSGTIDIDGVTLELGTPVLDAGGVPTGEKTPWSLDELRQAINDNVDLKDKVSANIVNEGNGQARLVLNSKTSGDEGRLEIDLAGLKQQNKLNVDDSFSQKNALIGGVDYTQVHSSGFYSPTELVESGSIKLSNFSGSGTLSDLTVDIAGLNLTDAAAKINTEIGASTLTGKLEAFIVNEGGKDRLEVRSTTGISNFKMALEDVVFAEQAVATDATKTTQNNNTHPDYKSLDAKITIDGIEATSSTNSFKNVVSGVDITLGADAEVGNKGTLNIARDDASISDNIDQFIKAYNDVVIHLNEAKKGPLASEGVIRSVENILRDTLFTPTGDSNDLQNTLASIGITSFVEKGWEPGEDSSSRNGTLEIDRTKLNQMLSEDFEKVAFIFGNEETGYAARFEQAARRLTADTVVDGEISKGLISTRKTGLSSLIGRIDDRMESTNLRLELLEARLYKQFNAADIISAQFNSTASYLTQQMDNLPGYTRK